MPTGKQRLTPTTEFRAVDLVIRSRYSLAPLVAAWPWAQVPESMAGRRLGWIIVRPDVEPRTCESAVKSLLRLIRSLPPGARRCWNAAYSKTFDVGIQAGLSPGTFEQVTLSQGILEEVAKVGGRVRITVYAPIRE